MSKIPVPQVSMALYETDQNALQSFLQREKPEEAFCGEFLILYNFADDCRYARSIQPDLIRYLLPFYFKAIELAAVSKNKIAEDVFWEFNSALFLNTKNIREAVGEKNFQSLMSHYITQAIRKMDTGLEWVALFNTAAAFYSENIRRLFDLVFQGGAKLQASFFQYLTIFLFQESSNLLAPTSAKAFWTSVVWDFKGACFGDFFWKNETCQYFDREITEDRIKTLFYQIILYLEKTLGPDLIELFFEEMCQNLQSGLFVARKAEFLEKISRQSGKPLYWDAAF